MDAFANRLIPLYPACKQITSWRIAQAVDTALDSLGATGWDGVGEPLPAELRAGARPGAAARGAGEDPPAADQGRHRGGQAPAEVGRGVRPPGRAGPPPGRGVRAARRAAGAAARTGCSTPSTRRLPFTLTEGQRTVSAEIFADLATDHPMHRLLQGEVGSGKTLVALRAMLGGGRRRRAGRDAGAHRGAGPAAPPVDHRDDGRAGRGAGCSAAPTSAPRSCC